LWRVEEVDLFVAGPKSRLIRGYPKKSTFSSRPEKVDFFVAGRKSPFSSYALLSPELLNEKSSNQLHFMPAALICSSAARSRLNDIYPLRVIFSAKPTVRTTT